MRIFTLSDPHLGFAVNKPMDVFGPAWKDHPEKIEKNWRKAVGKGDTVLVPGDISWGMNYAEAAPDLAFLDSLPGTKYICRGNHDYWWSSLAGVREATGPSVIPLQRSAVDCGDWVLAASRGWSTPLWNGYRPADDDRIYNRELGRMQIALEMARSLAGSNRRIIYMMHYPPVVDGRPSQFAEYLADAGIPLCIYGHLHGSWHQEVNMEHRGVVFRIASADYLDFKPLDITELVLG
jgi:uncharacterized protein